MAVVDAYYPFDSGSGANVTETQWSQFMRFLLGSGVIRGELNELEAYADSTGMQVKVKTGRCWILGHYGEVTNQQTLAIAAADPTNPRIDRVVARLDWTNNRIELAILTGTPAGSPSSPTLTRSATVWELSLGRVAVAAAATTIAAANVTDERRDSTVCGYTGAASAGTYSAPDGLWAPSCRVSNSGNIAVANTTYTAMTFDTESFDTDSMHSTSTNTGRITFNTPGTYLIKGALLYAANATGRRTASLRVNGATYIVEEGILTWGAGASTPAVCSQLYKAAAGDYVELMAYQDSGGSLNSLTSATGNPGLWATKVAQS
jgi:hypothetical protein